MNPTDLCALFTYARDHGLGLSTLHTLTFLLGNESVKMSALSREMGYTTAAATSTADRLETLGLICRCFAKDRRVVLMQLTPQGRDLITSAIAGSRLVSL